MRTVAAIAVASTLGFLAQSLESKAAARPFGLRTALTASAGAAVARSVADVRVAEQQPAAPAAPEKWIRAGAPNQLVLIPEHVCTSGKPFDLMIHFHGVPVTTEPNIARAKLDAVVSIVNWGIGSGAYENRFQQEGSLAGFIGQMERTVDRACGAQSGGARRVALSAWSAGYGAVYRILFHPKDAARVDSVILADGLHAGFVGYRKVNPLQMEGFAKFADEAAQGNKLFALSHSQVDPYKYASTTLTADYLLGHTGVTRTATDQPGPRKTRITSTADKNGFHVRSFGGGAIDDHAAHLYGIGDSLWTLLQARWAKQ